MGMIGMQPSEFWNSSPQEIHAAIEGFIEFNTGGEDTTPMSKNELHDLMELYPD
tara:strand:+ start:106 stop:267 length:162 start_codon:yes stop_codon:yes gene_type:complete